jgi:hypothetical protein
LENVFSDSINEKEREKSCQQEKLVAAEYKYFTAAISFPLREKKLSL